MGERKLRFYTLPPNGVNYPFLLVNRKNYRVLFKRRFRHAIIDSGVMDFVRKNIRDYPSGFLKTWKHTARALSDVFGEKIWLVIPDYPDDYNPGQFGDNVAKTLENIKDFITVDGVNWLPVIQSRYLNRFSFLESAKQVKEIVGEYPRVAIGTVCKCNRLDFIIYCCKVARKIFPNSWVHAFGLTLKALPKVAHLIDSFDSMAWTFPRESGGHSCKNMGERLQYFHAYLHYLKAYGLEDVGGHPPHPQKPAEAGRRLDM